MDEDELMMLRLQTQLDQTDPVVDLIVKAVAESVHDGLSREPLVASIVRQLWATGSVSMALVLAAVALERLGRAEAMRPSPGCP